MPAALAVTLVSAIGLSLAALGSLGVLLASWQLLGWIAFGGLPPVADVWRHSGLTGELMVALFAWLPLVLLLAIAFHGAVAWLGAGLVWRRPWARRGAIVFAAVWIAATATAWLVVHHALLDLARGYAARAAFARAALVLANQVTLATIGLATALILLMIQPAVRAQFSAGR
jgi:hypothetical protein